MAQVKVYSRSNVTGNPYLWRPQTNIFKKEHPAGELGAELICDNENDFRTTYMVKRVWDNVAGVMTAPVYVVCDYVQ